MVRNKNTVGRTPLRHPTGVIAWAVANLDRALFLEILHRDVDDAGWLNLCAIAGQHMGRAAMPDGGVPMPEARRQLARIYKLVAELEKLFDQPEGKAVELELDILDDFLAEHPSEFSTLRHRAPVAVDTMLAALRERLAILVLAHGKKDATEGSFGYAHRTSWNMTVVVLAAWCAENGISTNYHARGEYGETPVFRKLVAAIDALLPESHRQKFQLVDAEIRAIERALSAPTSS